MELLNSGVDSLYWTARGDVSDTATEVTEYQTAARAEHRAVAWREFDGFSLSVERGGGSGYPLRIECAEFTVFISPQRTRPTFLVQLRAEFIHSAGIRQSIEQSVAVVSQLSGCPLEDVGVSRVDPFADIGGWSLRNADADGFVTRVPDIRLHYVPRSGLLHSVGIGKKPLALRVYDKRRQLKKKGGGADLFWGDFTGPVTRVEFEFWTERLKEFGVRSFDDVLASLGDLWLHGASKFAQLRTPGAGPVESWPVAPPWEFVQRVAEWKFSHTGVVPFRRVKGDRITLLRNQYGYLASFAAVEGISGEREALRRLGECLAEVSRGRRFEDEVARKAARLPKAYRLRPAV